MGIKRAANRVKNHEGDGIHSSGIFVSYDGLVTGSLYRGYCGRQSPSIMAVIAAGDDRAMDQLRWWYRNRFLPYFNSKNERYWAENPKEWKRAQGMMRYVVRELRAFVSDGKKSRIK